MRILNFEGVLFPPNDDINLPLINTGFKGKDDAVKGDISFSIANSIVTASVKIENYDGSFGNIKNSLEYFVNASLDAYGYVNGTAHEVKFGICIENEETMYTINPGAKFLRESIDARPLDTKEVIEIQHKCPYLMDVLSNFRKAMKYAEDRGFFCYRVIETIQQYFKEINNCDDALAWEMLRECLKVSKEYLFELKKHSDSPRHGKFASISDTENEIILSSTVKVIDRFVVYVEQDSCLDASAFPMLVIGETK